MRTILPGCLPPASALTASGYLSDPFEAGLIGRVVERAEQLLATAEANLGSSGAA